MSAKKLSIGEKKFINAYNGNVKETAESLKLSYGYCRKLMTQEYILDGIRKREEKLTEKSPAIATRRERQEFWTGVMNGTIKEKKTIALDNGETLDVEFEPAMRDRLKAAELLGKSNADFTENLNHTGLNEGVKKEVTDNMPVREATNNFFSMLKEPNAGNA